MQPPCLCGFTEKTPLRIHRFIIYFSRYLKVINHYLTNRLLWFFAQNYTQQNFSGFCYFSFNHSLLKHLLCNLNEKMLKILHRCICIAYRELVNEKSWILIMQIKQQIMKMSVKNVKCLGSKWFSHISSQKAKGNSHRFFSIEIFCFLVHD